MKFKYFLVPVLAILTCGGLQAQSTDATPSASPEYGHHQHWKHHGWIWKKLNLTDAQKTQIKSIRQALKSQTRPALAAVLTARLKLHQDIDANNEQALAADASALATAVSQLATARATELSQIKGVLTESQKATWQEFHQKREARMQDLINKLNQPTT